MLILAALGPSLAAMLLANRQDPLVPDCGQKICCSINRYSMDLLAPFIHGGNWRFAHWTQWYWAGLPNTICEGSVCLGLSVIAIVVYVWIKRRQAQTPNLGLWYLLALGFGILALGPVLHIAGKEFSGVTLPYSWLRTILPGLSMARAPARFIVFTTLCVSVLCAVGFKMFLSGTRTHRWAAVVLLALLFIESLPISPCAPNFELSVPGYVTALKNLPGKDGLLDTTTAGGLAMYYQTIHEKPMAFGLTARVPTSLREKEAAMVTTLHDKDFSLLAHRYRIRYLIAPAQVSSPLRYPPARLIYNDGATKVFDLMAASSE